MDLANIALSADNVDTRWSSTPVDSICDWQLGTDRLPARRAFVFVVFRDVDEVGFGEEPFFFDTGVDGFGT
jgi:hypothetical protein